MQSIEVELKQAIQSAVKKALLLKHQKIKIMVIFQVMLRCS